MTSWIFLSPHLDDAVYSCGGLIRDRVDAGNAVAVWTVFAGDPPDGGLSAYAESLHERWGVGRQAAVRRRAEDVLACGLVGAGFRHFERPDCIYRGDPESGEALYQSDEAIFGEPAAVEADRLVRALAREWEEMLPPGARVVSPLGLGGHVDHRLVRRAAERLARELWYYADAPYVFEREEEINARLPVGAEEARFPVSASGFEAWMRANAAYESQLSSFWGSVEEMEGEFREYLERAGELRLWRAKS
ncbi:MAG TPA: PIG-L family deacetylase [Anaerolineales bacterium]|nr:PIG-L family deacetylase [Anaerolineales bacterium]